MGLTVPPWLDRLGGWAQNYWFRFQALIGVRDLPDITKLNSQLWTGGAIVSDEDVAYLVAVGITADEDNRLEYNDISVVSEWNDAPGTPASLKVHPDIKYLYNGVADDGEPKPVSWFQTTWVWAQPILASGGVVLCHCAAGQNRGPSMAYFLLRAYWHIPAEGAKALIQTKRPIATLAYRNDADEAIIALGLDT